MVSVEGNTGWDGAVRRRYSRGESPDEQLAELRAKYPPIDVDVIKTHPDTGEKYIFWPNCSLQLKPLIERALSL